jgi:hypothetical protein
LARFKNLTNLELNSAFTMPGERRLSHA